MILGWGAIALATIVATWQKGVPWTFHHTRMGRLAVTFTGIAYVALFALWLLREHGMLGGPVPV
jgi:hypothetical protein